MSKVNGLIEQLSSKRWAERMAAANALGNLGAQGQAAVPVLAQLLASDSNIGVRNCAFSALGKIKGAGAIKAQTQALKDEVNWEVLGSVADALGQFDVLPRPALVALAQATTNKNTAISSAASRALFSLAANKRKREGR